MSSTLTEANTIRRMRALEKLEIRIPRVNITSIIIRITQFLVLSLFSVGYAMSRPDVSLDIFVWPKEPPNSTFKVYVYRNTTNEWQSRAERLREPQELADVYHATDFEYNKTQFNPAEHGLSERYDCKDDPRWNCTGNEWAASRIGWVDSWPFKHPPPRWTKATVHIDRKIFYMMLLGVCGVPVFWRPAESKELIKHSRATSD